MEKRLITLFIAIDVIVILLTIALFHVEPIYANLLSPIIIMNLVSKEFRKAYFGKIL